MILNRLAPEPSSLPPPAKLEVAEGKRHSHHDVVIEEYVDKFFPMQAPASCVSFDVSDHFSSPVCHKNC